MGMLANKLELQEFVQKRSVQEFVLLLARMWVLGFLQQVQVSEEEFLPLLG